MTDPIRLLEQYGDGIDATVPPVTIDEVQVETLDPVVRRRPVRIPAWAMAVAAAVAAIVIVGGASLLFGGTDEPLTVAEDPTPTTTIATTVAEPTSGTVRVSLAGVNAPVGGDLAGVLYAGDELTRLDVGAIGGFATVPTSRDFSTEVTVYQPASAEGLGPYPYVTEEALIVEPGMYTLLLWADTGLGSFDRWIPVNTDGMGLVGCRHVFEVTDGGADISLAPTLAPNGWTTDCTTGDALPGIDPAEAVDPGFGDWDDAWVDPRPQAMLPVTGLGDGTTVTVSLTGLDGPPQGDLAGVVYADGELTDLDAPAIGGFWSVITDSYFSTSEVVREPGEPGDGRYPYVTSEALVVEPGTYTLVLWTDTSLGEFDRWIPVNTDGAGLQGCRHVFEVGDASVDIELGPTLVPNGWTTDCTTGDTLPDINPAEAVNPGTGWGWGFSTGEVMPPVTGLGDGATVTVSVSDVLDSHPFGDLVGIVYATDDLTDLSVDALGGFWFEFADEGFAISEVVREPSGMGDGHFPYVASEALVVTPGTYTLVLWSEPGPIGHLSRWVPINTDGMGLIGCRHVFEVTDGSVEVALTPRLYPNGWTTDCTTGAVVPGISADAAVNPWSADAVLERTGSTADE